MDADRHAGRLPLGYSACRSASSTSPFGSMSDGFNSPVSFSVAFQSPVRPLKRSIELGCFLGIFL